MEHFHETYWATITLERIQHLDYVILLCNDLPTMKQFYHETMGFPLYRDLDGWVEMRVGSVLLTLRECCWLTISDACDVFATEPKEGALKIYLKMKNGWSRLRLPVWLITILDY